VVVLVQNVIWPPFCSVSGGAINQSLMVLAPVVALKLAPTYGAGVVAGVGVGYGVWSCAGNTLPFPVNQLVVPTVVLWFMTSHPARGAPTAKSSTRSHTGFGGVAVAVAVAVLVAVLVAVNVFVAVGEAVAVEVGVPQVTPFRMNAAS